VKIILLLIKYYGNVYRDMTFAFDVTDILLN
jgi:hypothetical protein